MFFQFDSMKAALSILLQYVHDFDENLKTQYLTLVTNNDFDHKSYDARQHIFVLFCLTKIVF